MLQPKDLETIGSQLISLAAGLDEHDETPTSQYSLADLMTEIIDELTVPSGILVAYSPQGILEVSSFYGGKDEILTMSFPQAKILYRTSLPKIADRLEEITKGIPNRSISRQTHYATIRGNLPEDIDSAAKIAEIFFNQFILQQKRYHLHRQDYLKKQSLN